METQHAVYPKEPFVGVDCSGQPKDLSIIAVATRFSRRNHQVRWAIKVKEERVSRYRRENRDWQEKLYAAAFFRVIDRVFQARYEIHIDHEFPGSKSQKKVENYLLRLFGLIHAKEILWENPTICFKTKELSKYVRDADKKARWAHKGRMNLDERDASLDYLIKLLSS